MQHQNTQVESKCAGTKLKGMLKNARSLVNKITELEILGASETLFDRTHDWLAAVNRLKGVHIHQE